MHNTATNINIRNDFSNAAKQLSYTDMQTARFLARVTFLSYILGTYVVRADPKRFFFWGGASNGARMKVSIFRNLTD